MKWPLRFPVVRRWREARAKAEHAEKELQRSRHLQAEDEREAAPMRKIIERNSIAEMIRDALREDHRPFVHARRRGGRSYS